MLQAERNLKVERNGGRAEFKVLPGQLPLPSACITLKGNVDTTHPSQEEKRSFKQEESQVMKSRGTVE